MADVDGERDPIGERGRELRDRLRPAAMRGLDEQQPDARMLRDKADGPFDVDRIPAHREREGADAESLRKDCGADAHRLRAPARRTHPRA